MQLSRHWLAGVPLEQSGWLHSVSTQAARSRAAARSGPWTLPAQVVRQSVLAALGSLGGGKGGGGGGGLQCRVIQSKTPAQVGAVVVLSPLSGTVTSDETAGGEVQAQAMAMRAVKSAEVGWWECTRRGYASCGCAASRRFLAA